MHPLAHEVVAAHAGRAPGAIAVEEPGAGLTYGELDARATRLARALRGEGIGAGEIVAVCADRNGGTLVAMLAVWKAGACYLPLDPFAPPARLEAILRDASPRLLLAAGAAPGWARAVRTLPIDPGAADEGTPLPVVRPDDLAYVIYTSGSTGQPKGVLVEHGALAHRVEVQRSQFPLAQGERVSQFSSLAWDASLFELLLPLGAGATLRFIPEPLKTGGVALARFLSEERITVAFFPPSVLATIPPTPLPALRMMMTGGEACAQRLVDTWGVGRRFVDLYGPTEATVWCTTGERRPGAPALLGHPIPGVLVDLLDENGRPAAEGAVGEMHLGGVGLARGYLGLPEETARRFLDDPRRPGARLYRTGDLARRRPDGQLEFLGRTDRQAKVNGVRVELDEIETLLARVEGIRAAAVVAPVDPDGRARLVAYIVPDEPAAAVGAPSLLDPELRERARTALRAQLHEAIVPSLFVRLDAMPLTPNGKTDRQALPSAQESATRLVVLEPPRTETERVVADAWAHALGIPAVSRHDNVFTLGAHSLLAAHVQARLQAELGREVSIVELFENPTVAALARRLDGAEAIGALAGSAARGTARRAAMRRIPKEEN